jgi:non-heme chloroperoxidase
MSRGGLRALILAVFGLVASCHRGQRAPVAPTPPPSARSVPVLSAAALPLRAVQVNGTELRYADLGSGIPVIFVHGSFSTLDYWRPQLDSFVRHYRVIVYSRRHYPPNPQRLDGHEYGVSLHVDDLAGLLERLGIERAHIIGHSYGAYVALAFALRYPEKVWDLVLVEPPILPWLARTPEGDSLRRALEAGALVPARAAFARGDSVEGVRRYFDGATGAAGQFDALQPDRRAALLHLAFALRLELAAAPDVYTPSLACQDVAGIRSSVLLVTGQRSPRRYHVIEDELERCLRTAEVVTVPGADHRVPSANPQFFNQAVLTFLERH